MVRTWIADIRPLAEKEVYRRYYMDAPGFRKKKADRMRTEQGKMQSIGVWTLYENVCRTYNLNKDAVYNFSHSGDYVLCMVADAAVDGTLAGCDIEAVKTLRMSVARRFFCEEEYRWIESRESEEKQCQEFYRYWVLKESFMKAVRMGMKLPMNTYEIRIGADDIPVLTRQPDAIAGEFFFREYKFIKDGEAIPYKIAVCTTDQEIAAELAEIVL